ILCAPAVTVFISVSNRRTPSFGWTRPNVFWRAFVHMRSRRCRINHSAHNRFTLFAFAAVSALGLLLSGCRQDMHNQPKFIPLRSSEFFPDRRSARPPVQGTVAQLEDKDVDREQLDPSSYFLTGRHGSALGNDLPFPAETPEKRRDI